MTEPGRGVSNVILYSVLFDKQLDDDVVTRVAERAVEHPDAYLTTEQIYAGIAEALASNEILTESMPGHPHGEQEYRDFLARVARRLDAMRPWPQRPFQVVDPLSWYDLDYARLIARVKLSVIGVERRLHEVFGRSGDGRQVMALRLKSGAEVALVARWWPDSKDTALLQRDPRLSPPDVLAEFCITTGIVPDEITVVDQ
jgi:hypothetical protein